MKRWSFLAALLTVAVALSSCGSDSGDLGNAPGAPEDSTDATATSGPNPPPTVGAASSTAPADELRLVVIGDSIPYNSPDDCPGCTGFVEQYAQALSEATDRDVTIDNLTQHTGLTLPMLMDELDELETAVRAADAVIVAAAHNSILLNADEACGTTWDAQRNTWSDWSAIDEACTADWTAEHRPMFDDLFRQVASWRDGQPTILLAINKYNDWLGWADGNLTPELEQTTVMIHDAWNEMICSSAEENGLECVDIYHVVNGPDGDRAAGDLLAPDHAHPSQAGNDAIADALVQRGFEPLA